MGLENDLLAQFVDLLLDLGVTRGDRPFGGLAQEHDIDGLLKGHRIESVHILSILLGQEFDQDRKMDFLAVYDSDNRVSCRFFLGGNGRRQKAQNQEGSGRHGGAAERGHGQDPRDRNIRGVGKHQRPRYSA